MLVDFNLHSSVNGLSLEFFYSELRVWHNYRLRSCHRCLMADKVNIYTVACSSIQMLKTPHASGSILSLFSVAKILIICLNYFRWLSLYFFLINQFGNSCFLKLRYSLIKSKRLVSHILSVGHLEFLLTSHMLIKVFVFLSIINTLIWITNRLNDSPLAFIYTLNE